MPKPRSQNTLIAPLNEILGSPANVRLLRALVHAGIPVGPSELARRAHLGRTGVYPALANLERTGIVEMIGAGAQRQVVIRRAHPLTQSIVALFRAESKRIEGLVESLRSLFEHHKLRPVSAWLEGLAPDPGRQVSLFDQERVRCVVVHDPRELTRLADTISSNVIAIEAQYEVSVEVVALSPSEVPLRVPVETVEDAVLIAGVPPTTFMVGRGRKRRTVAGLSLYGEYDDGGPERLARAIAAKLRWDPSIIRRALKNLLNRVDEASPRERRELMEWHRILKTMPPAKLASFLLDQSEWAKRMRKTLPAVGLLSAKERDAVLRSRSEKEAMEIVRGGLDA